MKSALIMVGVIGLALAGMCGLFTTPMQTDVAPGCTFSPLGASADMTPGGWCHTLLSNLLQSLGGFVQYAEEEEEEALEEEKSEDWPPEPPDRILNAVQLA